MREWGEEGGREEGRKEFGGGLMHKCFPDQCHFSHHLDGHFLSVALASCTVDAGKPSLPQEVQDIVILYQDRCDQ